MQHSAVSAVSAPCAASSSAASRVIPSPLETRGGEVATVTRHCDMSHAQSTRNLAECLNVELRHTDQDAMSIDSIVAGQV